MCGRSLVCVCMSVGALWPSEEVCALCSKVRWVGKVSHKLQIVREKLMWLNEQKDYWRKLFASVQLRTQKVIDSGGGLLTK